MYFWPVCLTHYYERLIATLDKLCLAIVHCGSHSFEHLVSNYKILIAFSISVRKISYCFNISIMSVSFPQKYLQFTAEMSIT